MLKSNTQTLPDMDFDFWMSVLLGAIGGGVFGPLIVKYLQKKGWIKTNNNKKPS